MYAKTRYRMRSRAREGKNPRSEHRVVVEGVIGMELPRAAVIHHVNGDGRDNRTGNLVVCQSMGYHRLLHRRQRSYDATGDPSRRFCRFCSSWDIAENLYVGPRNMTFHRACRVAAGKRGA